MNINFSPGAMLKMQVAFDFPQQIPAPPRSCAVQHRYQSHLPQLADTTCMLKLFLLAGIRQCCGLQVRWSVR